MHIPTTSVVLVQNEIKLIGTYYFKGISVTSIPSIVTRFGKINHFVTFDTSNIYGQNNALYRVSVYT